MQKKSIFIVLLVFIVDSTFAMKHDEIIVENVVPVLKTYTALMGGTVTHELGHLVVGKMLYRCNGFIEVSYKGGGSCSFYHGPSFFTLFRESLKKVNKSLSADEFASKFNMHFIENGAGFRGAAVSAAGPLAGFMYCALLPFLNTVAAEYKRCGSLSEATNYARKRNYLNSDLDRSTAIASILLGVYNVLNLLPLSKELDGYKLLESLKLNRPAIRYSVIATPVVGLSIFASQALFKDKI